jgi:hypothetical protein
VTVCDPRNDQKCFPLVLRTASKEFQRGDGGVGTKERLSNIPSNPMTEALSNVVLGKPVDPA